MAERDLREIKQLLVRCTDEERRSVFDDLRKRIQIHQLEATFGAPAEVILDSIYRAPELTRRMLRGVIADAAFATIVVPLLYECGWKNVTPEGNHSFDHLLADLSGEISIQVKLQRSRMGEPLLTTGRNFGLAASMYMVEVQKTRTGTRSANTDKGETKTRPYRYGEFDILAVSLQPSSRDWSRFRYTVADWLLPKVEGQNEIGTYQPVPRAPNEDWSDDFNEVAEWLRKGEQKRISKGGADPLQRA